MGIIRPLHGRLVVTMLKETHSTTTYYNYLDFDRLRFNRMSHKYQVTYWYVYGLCVLCSAFCLYGYLTYVRIKEL